MIKIQILIAYFFYSLALLILHMTDIQLFAAVILNQEHQAHQEHLLESIKQTNKESFFCLWKEFLRMEKSIFFFVQHQQHFFHSLQKKKRRRENLKEKNINKNKIPLKNNKPIIFIFLFFRLQTIWNTDAEHQIAKIIALILPPKKLPVCVCRFAWKPITSSKRNSIVELQRDTAT